MDTPTRNKARASLALTLSTSDGAVLKRFNSQDGPVDLGRGHRQSPETMDLTSGRFRYSGVEVASSKQALLTWEEGESSTYAFLTDTNSTNGTFIERDGDQMRLKSGVAYRLENDDLITFGQAVLSSKAERKCEPTPLRVTITSAPVAVVAPLFLDPTSSSIAAPALARSRTLTSKQHSRDSTVSEAGDLQEEEHGDDEWKQSRIRTSARRFGLTEADLLSSAAESEDEQDVEVEIVMEEAILRTLKDQDPPRRRTSVGDDSDDPEVEDEVEIVETQPALVVDSDDESKNALSDMQIVDDDDEIQVESREPSPAELHSSTQVEHWDEEEVSDPEEDGSIVEEEQSEPEQSEPEQSEGEQSEGEQSEEDQELEDEVAGSVDRSPSLEPVDSPCEESPEILSPDRAVEDCGIDEDQAPEQQAQPTSRFHERLPSPVSPEQVGARQLSDIKADIKSSLERVEATVDALFPPSQLKVRVDVLGKAQLLKSSSPFDRAASQMSCVAVVEEDVASQTSHLPSPSSSIDLDLGGAEDEEAAAGAEDDDDIPVDYEQDFDEQEDGDEDDFEANEDELDLGFDFEAAQTAADWFDVEAVEDMESILAANVDHDAEKPEEEGQSSPEPEERAESPEVPLISLERLSKVDHLLTSRKRPFACVDSTSDAGVNTSTIASPPTVALPIAPLPKRRRIVRDVGAMTLGFSLGVVATVAGLSALSGVIQAMDV